MPTELSPRLGMLIGLCVAGRHEKASRQYDPRLQQFVFKNLQNLDIVSPVTSSMNPASFCNVRSPLTSYFNSSTTPSKTEKTDDCLPVQPKYEIRFSKVSTLSL